MKTDFYDTLEKEDWHLELQPTVNTHCWELMVFPADKEVEWIEEDEQVHTEVLLEICIVDDCGKLIETMGHALLDVVNAHHFESATGFHADCVNADLGSCLEALYYKEHIKNFKEKRFLYPYQPFVILSRLFIEEKYRGNGIGQLVVKNANALINRLLNLDTTLLIWQANPILGLYDVAKNVTAEERKRVHVFAKKAGAKNIATFGNEKYFCYQSTVEEVIVRNPIEDYLDE